MSTIENICWAGVWWEFLVSFGVFGGLGVLEGLTFSVFEIIWNHNKLVSFFSLDFCGFHVFSVMSENIAIDDTRWWYMRFCVCYDNKIRDMLNDLISSHVWLFNFRYFQFQLHHQIYIRSPSTVNTVEGSLPMNIDLHNFWAISAHLPKPWPISTDLNANTSESRIPAAENDPRLWSAPRNDYPDWMDSQSSVDYPWTQYKQHNIQCATERCVVHEWVWVVWCMGFGSLGYLDG